MKQLKIKFEDQSEIEQYKSSINYLNYLQQMILSNEINQFQQKMNIKIFQFIYQNAKKQKNLFRSVLLFLNVISDNTIFEQHFKHIMLNLIKNKTFDTDHFISLFKINHTYNELLIKTYIQEFKTWVNIYYKFQQKNIFKFDIINYLKNYNNDLEQVIKQKNLMNLLFEINHIHNIIQQIIQNQETLKQNQNCKIEITDKFNLKPIKNYYNNFNDYLQNIINLQQEDFQFIIREGQNLYKESQQDIYDEEDVDEKEQSTKKKIQNVKIYQNCLIDNVKFKNGFIVEVEIKLNDKIKIQEFNHTNNLQKDYLILIQLESQQYLSTLIDFQFYLDSEQIEYNQFENNQNKQKINLVKIELKLEDIEKSNQIINLICQKNNNKYVQIVNTNILYISVIKTIKQLKKMNNICFQEIILGQNLGSNNQIPLIYNQNKQKIQVYKQQLLQELQLDKSQQEAVDLCLNKKISIIQGPPGTGKTFIGANIAKLLQKLKLDKPIIVTCYTNHALDQFCQKIQILDQNIKIIKIGGKQCEYSIQKNPLYKELQIRNKFQAQLNQLNDELNQQIQDLNIENNVTYFQLLNNNPNDNLNQKTIQIYKQIQKIITFLLIKKIDQMDIGNLKDIILEELNELQKGQKYYYNNKYYIKDDLIQFYYDNKFDIIKYILKDNKKIVKYLNKLHSNSLNEIKNSNLQEEFLQFNQNIFLQQNSIYKFYLMHNFDYQITQISNQDNLNQKLDEIYLKLERNLKRLDFKNTSYVIEQFFDIQYQQELELKMQKFNDKYFEFQETQKNYNDFYDNQKVEILNKQDIIAFTITGMSIYSDLINKIQPYILIIEEACEITEPQVISCLNENIQSLILIGDHKQLRPKVNNIELIKYNLDISLFERLIGQNIKFITLQQQRRMIPAISRYIKYIYPKLKDIEQEEFQNEFVNNKPFKFIDNNFKEQKKDYLIYNSKEAQLIYRYIKFLQIKNVNPELITVISFYKQQIIEIQNLINKDNTLEKVTVKTVDNYQGEENHVVILSSVRNNDQKIMGFTKNLNRFNVSISRAKYGFYIFGSYEFMTKSILLEIEKHNNSKNKQSLQNLIIFQQILVQYKEDNKVDNIIDNCINHNKPIELNKNYEGCDNQCDIRLNCGHQCYKLCHDQNHMDLKCPKLCVKNLECNHKCTRKCYECFEDNKLHQKCLTKVQIQLKCQHTKQVSCYQQNEKYDCMTQINVNNLCGHKQQIFCKDLQNFNQFQLQMRNAIYKYDLQNYLKQNSEFLCKKKVNSIDQICLHEFQVNCYEQQIFKDFLICQKKCEKPFGFCNHSCQQPCHRQKSFTNCGTCQKQCQIRCSHSQCTKKCGETCVDCIENCNFSCSHIKCDKKCNQKCQDELCQLPCDKLLKCQHRCIGLCGDPCPPQCREIDCQNYKPEIFEILLGLEDQDDSTFILLPDCNHVFESQGIIKYFQTQIEEQPKIQYLQCFKCKKFVLNCKRISDYIKITQQKVNNIKIKQKIEEKKESNQQELLQNYIKDFKKQTIIISNKSQNIYVLQNIIDYLSQFINIPTEYINQIYNCIQIVTDLLQYQNLQDIQNLIQKFDYIQFIKNNNYRNQLQKEIQQLQIQIQIQIQKEEEKQLIKFIEKEGGHWYECPNGHPYAIYDCGMAMQISKCNDCGANIGGQSHNLLNNNKVYQNENVKKKVYPNDFFNNQDYALRLHNELNNR